MRKRRIIYLLVVLALFAVVMSTSYLMRSTFGKYASISNINRTVSITYSGSIKHTYGQDGKCTICGGGCNHVYNYVEEGSATCTDDGVRAHYICSRCGAYFTSQSNDSEVAYGDLIIPALRHSFTVLSYDNSTHFYTCARCGTVDETTRAAHSWSKDYTTDETYHWYECACGHQKSKAEHDFTDMTDTTYHWQECSCGKIRNKAAHSYNTQNDATNHWQECACGYKKDIAAHSYNAQQDATNHWQECSCGYKKDVAAHSYNTQYDATYHWQECSCGREKDKELHSTSTQYDETNHWQACECGYTSTPIAHTFGGEYGYNDTTHWKMCTSGCGASSSASHVVATEATCVAAAVCSICNKSYGSTNPNNHDWKDYYTQQNNKHWIDCNRACGVKLNEANCSGGTATCVAKAVCDTCKKQYGSVDSNNHSWSAEYTQANNQHWKTCDRGCGTTTAKTNCSGGTATCVAKAVCDTCKKQYGSFDSNNHSWSDYNQENGQHWQTCTRGCGTSTARTNCSGGTATCITLAVCSTCKKSYGVYAAHSYSGAWSTDGSNHWKACTVSGCNSTSNYGAHSTTQGWVTTDGTYHWKDCDTCGYDMYKGTHSTQNVGTQSVHQNCPTCGRVMSTTHSYSRSTQTAATCTVKGTSKYSCGCGYSYTSQDIAALGHDYKQNTAYTSNGAITCSRGDSTITPNTYFDAYEIAVSPKSANGGNNFPAGKDTNWGDWTYVTGAEGQSFTLNNSVGKYFVIKYGFVTEKTGKFDIVVGEGGYATLYVHTLDVVSSGAGTELISLKNTVGDTVWFVTQQITHLYIWSIASFNNKADAQAYQNAMSMVAMPNGQKPVNKGEASHNWT